MAVYIFDALPDQCRFPLWGPEKSIGDVCGERVIEGSSYCAACYRRTHYAEKPRAPFVPRDPTVSRRFQADDATRDLTHEIAA